MTIGYAYQSLHVVSMSCRAGRTAPSAPSLQLIRMIAAEIVAKARGPLGKAVSRWNDSGWRQLSANLRSTCSQDVRGAKARASVQNSEGDYREPWGNPDSMRIDNDAKGVEIAAMHSS
jgi:hypothetical protein